MGYASETLDDLQDKLAEKYESVPFWTAEEARLAINESCRIWNGITGYWRRRVPLTLVPNDPWLPLPSILTQRSRLEVAGLALHRSTINQLKYAAPYWRTETTSSGGVVPTSPFCWCPVGLSLVAIWPAVTTPTTVLVDGLMQTPVLVNDQDTLNMGDEELSTLLGFALHLLTFKGPDQQFAATKPLQMAFYKAAAERNDRFAKSDFLAQFMGQRKFRNQGAADLPRAIAVGEQNAGH